MRGIVDTGPLVAFIDGRDGSHAWAKETLSRFEVPLVTCDAVLSEAWYLLGRAKRGRQGLVELWSSGALAPALDLAAEATAVLRLLRKYADQPMSVADACLVRMAELDPAATIVTIDRDFLVYRRGRSALRLAAPFGA